MLVGVLFMNPRSGPSYITFASVRPRTETVRSRTPRVAMRQCGCDCFRSCTATLTDARIRQSESKPSRKRRKNSTLVFLRSGRIQSQISVFLASQRNGIPTTHHVENAERLHYAKVRIEPHDGVVHGDGVIALVDHCLADRRDIVAVGACPVDSFNNPY